MVIMDRTNNEEMKIYTTNLDKTIKHLHQQRPEHKLDVIYIKGFQKIQCPNCEKVIDGITEWQKGDPFWTHVCECPHCEYIITESEWCVVDEPKKIIRYNGNNKKQGNNKRIKKGEK